MLFKSVNIKKIITLLLLLCTCIILHAQTVDTTFSSGKCKVKKAEMDVGLNYRNDSNNICFVKGDAKTVMIIDDNLNIIDTCYDSTFVDRKNTLWATILQIDKSIYSFYKITVDTSGHEIVFSYNNIINTIYFRKLVVGNNGFITDTVLDLRNDSIKWNDFHVQPLKNKNILLYLVDTTNDDMNYYSNYVKVIEIDTLGNIVKGKLFTHNNCVVDLCEFNDSTLLMAIESNATVVNYMLVETSVIYYLDRNTFDIRDSISGYPICFMRKINDSILSSYIHCATTLDEPTTKLCLLNMNTKQFDSINNLSCLENNNFFIDLDHKLYRYKYTNEVTDFKTTDSIYSCFYLRNALASFLLWE